MKTRFLLLVLAVFAFACSRGHKWESVGGDPMHARIYTLDNGLKVYMTSNSETPRVTAYIAVRVGGKNDPATTTGLAHYFEHLMFKGTSSFGTMDWESEKPLLDRIEQQFEVYRSLTDEGERREAYRVIDSLSYEASRYAIPNEYDKLMSAIGSVGTNAYTGMDMTVYVEDIPSNQIENWAMIQADRFRDNVIRGFHTELETVYEEKNMSLTQDGNKVYYALMAALFPDHPYGTQDVLGSQEHLKNPSITRIKKYYSEWYVPNNMAICLAGDLDFDETIKIIEKHFGSMTPNDDLPAPADTPEAPIAAPVVKEVLGLDAANVSIAWRADRASSADAALMEVMSMVMYNGRAGLIDLDLNQKQRVLSAWFTSSGDADRGYVRMSGTPKAGQTLDEVRELLLAEVERLKAGDFDESLVEAAVNNYKVTRMIYLDSNRGRADAFVNSFVLGIPWADYVAGNTTRLDGITKEQIVAYANRIMGEDNYAVVYKREGRDPNELTISKPEITPLMTNRDTSSRFLREVQLREVTPIEPVFVDYERDLGHLRAASGIEVLYKRNETNGIFEVDYVFETGSNNDPALSAAFEYLEYLGTDDMTADEVSAEFYRLACSYGFSAGPEQTTIYLYGLGENMGRAMELLEKVIREARPDAAVLENLKTDILKRRADAKLNQQENLAALNRYAVYGPGSRNILSNARIRDLTPEYLLERIRELYNMEHYALYYGPAGESELIAQIDTRHRVDGALQPVPELKRFLPLATPENKVFLARYDAAQIYFQQVSNTDMAFDAAAEPIRTLYNSYFGSGMNAIVFQEMREARGLAYSARAVMSGPARAGDNYIFTASIATQNDKMGEAIDAFESIIDDMPVSDNAFGLAKESILTNIRTGRVIKFGVLSSYISARRLGLDYDIRRTIFDRVGAMTLDDVVRFQQERVRDRTYTYSILGDIEKLDMAKLRSIGKVQVLGQQEIFGY